MDFSSHQIFAEELEFDDMFQSLRSGKQNIGHGVLLLCLFEMMQVQFYVK